MDRWIEEISREMFGRRWLSPFERLLPSFPEFRSAFEGRMPFEGRTPRAVELGLLFETISKYSARWMIS